MTEITPEKDSIVKTLLTSMTPLNLSAVSKLVSTSAGTSISKPTTSSMHYSSTSSQLITRIRTVEDSTPKVHNYYNQFAGMAEKDQGIVAVDHCYARPLNWTPESAFFQPTKTLFIPQQSSTKRKSSNPLAPVQDCEDIIDVESVPLDQPELYDAGKAMFLMNECERHAVFARINQGNDDWEDTISRLNWTPAQNRLFNGMVNILNSDRLAHLAHADAHHEPILRRLAIDKSVKRVRHLFSTISWDPRLTQWLHQLLIDNLSTSYLAAYLDILQSLKAKLPTSVDKMMYGPNANSRVGVTSNESLFPLLKRQWDPFSSHLQQNRPRKLPGNPIIIIAPSAPTTSNVNHFKRQLKWTNLLSNLATVVAVHTNIGNTANRMTMTNCADQMLAATRTKVQEVKTEYPGRPIVLVGFNAGSALALQVAQVEHVVCVICLGFSILTAEGKRGDPEDSILELQCPVLFVIGQCSNTSLQEDLEDLRERMRVENGLIVVGSADDYLRVSKKKKRSEGVTQSAVDRIIVENIGEFVSGLLLSPYPPQVRQSPTHASIETAVVKRSKVERRRNNSNGSSIDSEPPSPTPKITRPVGRPPGSKSKTKLEAKWAAHVVQGIPSPSNSPPPPTPIITETPTLPQLLPPPTLQPPEISPVSPKNLLNSDFSKSTNDRGPATSTIDTSSKSHTSQNKAVPSTAAKMQAMGMNRSVLTSGSTLSNLLQTSCRPTLPIPQTPKQSSGIKVLENLTLNTNSSAKLISSATGRSIDLSKITVLNSVNSSKTSASVGNVVLIPDGKLKPIGSTVKGTGSTPILLPMSNKHKMSSIHHVPTSSGHRVAKYITSKKQLIGRRPPNPTPKPQIISSYSSNLPPPTNLTSQDIMDLPIIFADDNQMLTDNSKLQQSDVQVPEIVQPPQPPLTKPSISNPVGKFVFINKQVSLQSAVTPTISPTTTLKRPALSVPVRTNTMNPVKYTKIIISRGSTTEPKSSAANAFSKISNLSPEISIRKVEPSPTSRMELEDVENAIACNTITIQGSVTKTEPKMITTENLKESQTVESSSVRKRTASEAELCTIKNDDPSSPKKNKLDTDL